ncbi:hypothetical protein BGZ75_009801, partial [Mortierella antarctica]
MKNIRIVVSMKASTSLMLESMAASVDLDPYSSVATSRVFMNMTDPVLKKALARNCTLDNLELKEKLVIHALEGNITVRNVRVGQEVRIETKRGDIETHRLWADERVVAKAAGSVVMDMGATSQYLDLEVISTRKAAAVIL